MHDELTRTAVLRLARRQPPPSRRSIARALDISRASVDAILDSGQAAPVDVPRPSKLDPHLDRIRALHVLCRTNLVRVHEMLAAEGVEVPYQTLTAFCRRNGIGRTPKERAGQYHFEPGEEMQHDTSPHRAMVGGKEQLVQCASLVLCYSQRVFAQCYPRFNRFYAKAFLTEALQWFGGAAGRCVVDNSNIVLARGTGKNAVAAPEMAAFAGRFGFVWLAHELGDANRSARVERPFDYIERNFYPGRTFADFDDLNAQLREWCTRVDHKLKRRLQTTPIALFATEQSALRPLPLHVPEVYDLVRRSVDLEGFVHYATNRYSVPDGLIGHEVEVRAGLVLVSIVDRHKVIATHRRVDDGQHACRTLPEHRKKRRGPAGSAPPLKEEGPLRAGAPELAALVDAFKRHHGGRAVRPIRKLYRMFLEYPPGPLIEGVRRALEYGLLDPERIERIVLRQIAGDFFRQPLEDQDG